MNNHEQEFTDVIQTLSLLHQVKPESAFRNRMERKVHSFKPYVMPLFALRVAMIVFVVLLSGTSVFAAAKQSKPGDALYPVKQLTDSLKTTFTAEKNISQAPSAPVQKPTQQNNAVTQTVPEPTPTTSPKKQLNETKETKTTPIPTATNAPTPTSVQQGVLPAAQNAVKDVTEKLPVKVNLSIGGTSDPTPTPHSHKDGSKDNGRNAGAGGSLLPQINIGL